RTTERFPSSELYGLTSQLRRSAASVAAHMAEGCVRSSDADFCRFLWVALGSASEVEYHLLLARDLGLLSADDYVRLSDPAVEIKRMLVGLIRTLTAESFTSRVGGFAGPARAAARGWFAGRSGHRRREADSLAAASAWRRRKRELRDRATG